MKLDWGQVLAEADARPDSLPLAAARRLLHSPRSLQLARWIAPRDPRLPARFRPSAEFTLELIRQARLEEIDLIQRIPEYREYMRDVPRFIPR